MEWNIKDLLDDYTDDEIEMTDSRTPRPEKIERIVMERINRTERRVNRRRFRSIGRVLRTAPIAAAVACLLTVTAYATVGSRLLERSYRASGDRPANAVSTVGYEGSPEFFAAMEWEEYQQEAYKNNDGSEYPMALPDESWNPYWENGARTRADRDKLEQIVEAYDLTLVNQLSIFSTPEELYALTGRADFLPPLGDSGRDPETGPDPLDPDSGPQQIPLSGTLYTRGCFTYGGSALLQNGLSVHYSITSVTKGSFMRGAGIMTRNENFVEWDYVTGSGTELTLDLGASRAFIMAELEDCYVFIFVRSGSEPHDTSTDQGRIAAYNGFAVLDTSMLEGLADLFDFETINSLGS